jgi:uncharacterized YccA/Bax inhibitor family protein
MARHNIVFGKDSAVTGVPGVTTTQQGSRQGQFSSDFSGQGSAQGYGTATAQAPTYGAPTQQTPGQDQLEAMYARPAASGYDTGRMTLRDALNAITATLGLIIVVGAGVGLLPTVLGLVAGYEGFAVGVGLATVAMVIGLIGGLVTGLVNSFKKKPSAVSTLLYAGFEGMVLGGLSGLMEQVHPGIALQAVLGTLAVAGTVLVLFRLGVLKTSPALTKIFFVAMIAYLVFGLVNIGVMLATGTSLREGVLGLVIGGLAVVMASYSLVMDFEDVQRATNAGVPRNYAWRCAFGLAATLVWMYIEILRIISILRSN